jgi:hypothetical protein
VLATLAPTDAEAAPTMPEVDLPEHARRRVSRPLLLALAGIAGLSAVATGVLLARRPAPRVAARPDAGPVHAAPPASAPPRGRRPRLTGQKMLRYRHLAASLSRLPATVYDEAGRAVAEVDATFDVRHDLWPLLRTLRLLRRAPPAPAVSLAPPEPVRPSSAPPP